MSNKVKYGLKNVHYAPLTETNGIVTYGDYEKIPGAVNLTTSPVGDTVEFYADDVLYYNEDVNDGYDGNLEIALIPDKFRVDVFGDTIDANGGLIENTNTAKSNKIALAFEFNGDAKKTRHVLYSVKVSRPNIDASTKTKTKEVKTESMAIQSRPRIDTGDVKAKLEQGKAGYDSFFSKVYEPTTTEAGE